MLFLISYLSVLCILYDYFSMDYSLVFNFPVLLICYFSMCLGMFFASLFYLVWYLLSLPTQPTPLLVRVGDTISVH